MMECLKELAMEPVRHHRLVLTLTRSCFDPSRWRVNICSIFEVPEVPEEPIGSQ